MAVLGLTTCAAVYSLGFQYPPGSGRPQLTVIASVAWPLAWIYALLAVSRWGRALRQSTSSDDAGAEAGRGLARRVMWIGVAGGLVIVAASVWALLTLEAFERSTLRLTAFLVVVAWLGMSLLLLRPYRARR